MGSNSFQILVNKCSGPEGSLEAALDIGRIVAQELASGTLSIPAAKLRKDELIARGVHNMPADCGGDGGGGEQRSMGKKSGASKECNKGDDGEGDEDEESEEEGEEEEGGR